MLTSIIAPTSPMPRGWGAMQFYKAIAEYRWQALVDAKSGQD